MGDGVMGGGVMGPVLFSIRSKALFKWLAGSQIALHHLFSVMEKTGKIFATHFSEVQEKFMSNNPSLLARKSAEDFIQSLISDRLSHQCVPKAALYLKDRPARDIKNNGSIKKKISPSNH